MTKPASPPVAGGKPVPSAPPPPPSWRHWLWVVAVAAFVLLFFVLPATRMTRPVNLTYSQFVRDVAANKVSTVTLNPSGSATGLLKDGHHYTVVIPQTPSPGASLLDQLQHNKVQVTATTTGPSFGSQVLSWVILLMVLALPAYLWYRLSKRGAAAGGGLSGIFGAGQSKAKLFEASNLTTTFADVAGYEGVKAEVAEVVEFLKRPDRYERAGAMPPRGILMVGPPGTGKTLLARAVAGEAGVAFFSVTGSSFVEMFVGVGAARVRDLFAEARKRAPAIVFMDEIDAIGQRRSGTGVIVSNDEREQTLNQLLAEMDGFDVTKGIVVLAATNRPEVLDPALLRPGRFDRQVQIPLPTLSDRLEILKVHCRGKRLDHGVDLGVVARGTPGFSGADLANLVNEAAINAAHDNRDFLVAADFDQARDRVILGRREGSNVLLPEEKEAVAVHEAGHALVAALVPKADPVAKVTILPAGQALGATEQLPLTDRHLYGEDYLYDSLAVRLGGRAAELVELGQGSTGAANDLASATELAVRMVREFGLSKQLGPVGYPEGGPAYLGGSGAGLSSRPFAEETQALIDAEVRALLIKAEQRAVALLTAERDKLRRLADLLMTKETVDGADVYAIAGVREPERLDQGTTVAPGRAAASATERQAGPAPTSVAVAEVAEPAGDEGGLPRD